MKDIQLTIADIRSALDTAAVPYEIRVCDECKSECAAALKATVIRATDKACAVVLHKADRRLAAAVRIPKVQTAESHSGWPFGCCCPFATAKRLHVSVWADVADDVQVCVPGGRAGTSVRLLFGDLVKALVALKLLGKLDRKSDFVN